MSLLKEIKIDLDDDYLELNSELEKELLELEEIGDALYKIVDGLIDGKFDEIKREVFFKLITQIGLGLSTFSYKVTGEECLDLYILRTDDSWVIFADNPYNCMYRLGFDWEIKNGFAIGSNGVGISRGMVKSIISETENVDDLTKFHFTKCEKITSIFSCK